MDRIKCLWCKRTYDGDEDGYHFCDDCIIHLEEIEQIVRKETGRFINITSQLEKQLGSK